MMNGSTGPYGLDIDEENQRFEFIDTQKKKGTWLSDGFLKFGQTLCILDNIKSPYLSSN